MAATSTISAQIDPCEMILLPTTHITLPGPEYRNITKRLSSACNFWIKCPKDKRKVYGDIGDSLFNMALIADDIEDETILRRGIPTAHMIYGIPLTLHATIYKTTLLFEKLLYHLKDDKEIVVDGFIKTGIEAFTGQGVEIYHRDIIECPTFDDYRVIIHGKSAAILIWGVQLLQLFAKKKRIEFSADFWDKMVHFIQIYNDYINLHNSKYATIRVYCDDLDEGKFSFPIIHAIQSHPEDNRLLNMLKSRPLTIESKKNFVEIMESFGSFEYTRNVLEDLKKGILEEVIKMKLERNLQLERVLEDIFTHLETEIFADGCD
ncbi:hypothetical protein Zmor_023478 [Zophobas morio]|uniref:Geranylgeranyl pyrophosphate synthase n=1 Tax=Zophobas morio TaxID=2755281 RepID=A0AA38I339_9CUCU|nr:hypothetical protein Zmor_023478 [Zophobas morio]